MSYEPITWDCGDVITAEKLNNMERGISEVNENYVPTEWQCGDIFTAERLNKMEQGIANASGGETITVEPLSVTANDTYTAPSGSAYSPVTVNVESDFSTAEVQITIQHSASGTVVFEGLPYIYNNQVLYTNPTNGGTYTVPLYKGLAQCEVAEGAGSANAIESITVSGNATKNGTTVLIRGNCSITVELRISKSSKGDE